MKSLFFFSISGGIGFIIDASVYYLVSHAIPYYGAKLISFISAVFFTWIFNRNITFRYAVKSENIFIEFAKYFSSMLLGGMVNYIVFIILMRQSFVVQTYPIIGIACGSIVGLICNFSITKLMIYNKKKDL
ncbi:GtrA family protein [Glaesserella sp.]|uniref:GtrA family protein n=1 Tax=Glaesserella sp. TaxID=2094731 RepID=UPI0035A1201F